MKPKNLKNLIQKKPTLNQSEQVEYARAFMDLLDMDSDTEEDAKETIIKLIGEKHLNNIIEARDTLYGK